MFAHALETHARFGPLQNASAFASESYYGRFKTWSTAGVISGGKQAFLKSKQDHHKNVFLRGIGAHEFLDLFALGHETDHGARIGLRVDLVLLLETFVKMLSEPKVEVATADVRIASRGQHL